jgi:NAD+ kinase
MRQVHWAGRLQRVHHVLNEAVIDRGAFPGAVFLEVYVDGNFVTAAEADGLIIATPSGSTAYSMSAGGPMVAPSVPCTLLTPLAPLSLSFRPLIVPESSDTLVRLPGYSRSHARASFDGKHPLRVPKESSVHFTTSLCPLPVINMNSLDVDW